MQKNKAKDQEQKRKPRCLTLNRETLRVLNEPALLELARGGVVFDGSAGGFPRCAGTTTYTGCK